MTAWSLLVEFARSTRSTLDAVKRLTKISQERFSDKRFGEVFYRMLAREMEKTEDWASRLLEYVRVTTPVEKTGTLHTLLEETLKEYQPHLDGKKIEVEKELETNLPETIVPDEEMRYILKSLLQYATNVIPTQGFLKVSTRSSMSAGTKEQVPFTTGRKSIEISTKFSAGMKQSEGAPARPGTTVNKQETILKFEIWLLEQVVKRNQGSLTFEVDKEREEISISLRFPIERRRVVYYQAADNL